MSRNVQMSPFVQAVHLALLVPVVPIRTPVNIPQRRKFEPQYEHQGVASHADPILHDADTYPSNFLLNPSGRCLPALRFLK